MIEAARNSKCPIFFFQAANDYNLAPTRVLSTVMKQAGKLYKARIYPSFGRSAEDGHSFAYQGTLIWGNEAIAFLKRNCM